MSEIVRLIINKWSSKGLIAKSEEEIYDYGLQLILFTLVNFTVILTTAVLVGRFTESVALLATFIPIQAYGGGFHAKTHLRCFLIMYVGWWIAIFVILPIFCSTGATLSSVLALITIYFLAPVPHINVEMSDEHRMKLRIAVRIGALLAVMISLIVIHVIANNSIIGISMTLGIVISAFSMLIAGVKTHLFTGKSII